MRYWMMGAALAAVCSAGQAQDTAWGAFEAPDGSAGVGIQAADGSQLLLKCDKPGSGSVYAVVVTTQPLVPPTNNRFSMRPVEVRFDTKPPIEERWRFYEQSAVAVNQRTERTLARFLRDLPDAQTLTLRMNPERARWVTATFDVAGAREAMTQVFESCQDNVSSE